MTGVPRRPWCELVSLRPQFRRCLALTFEAALDSVAGAAAVGVKCRAIHALEIGMDQSDISRMSRNRTAGRLEGTHAFPLNHVPEPRTHGRFLNQIDVTMEERGEHLSELFQPAKMIEPSGRESDTRPDCQIHVRRVGCLAARQRAKQCDCLHTLRPQLRLVSAKNSQQLGAGP